MKKNDIERIALIPGTFDPFTVGHLELVKIASAMFDKVVVCILTNPNKTHLFDEKSRLEMIRRSVSSFSNVSVDVDHGYTADYAKRIGAEYIVRGIRNEIDAKYEMEMADFNLKRTGVRTLLIPAPEEIASVSSTRVRENLKNGDSVDALVPGEIKTVIQ
jgi:pantetheine-phosphate adenylyltransferase